MTFPQSFTTYALLFSQDPDRKHIRLFTKSNSAKSFEMKDEWRIYYTPETFTLKIINLSDSKIKIGDTWLKKNEERALSGDEIITFNDQKSYKLEYVVAYEKEQKVDGKRPRSENVYSKYLTAGQKKSMKVQEEDDLKEELACSICRGTIYNPVTVGPCGHHFCSGCLSENIGFSTKCPICREEITSFRKDPLLNALTNQTTKSCPSLQRSKEECISLDEKDLISKGYKLVRDEDGVYFGEYLNGKKHGEGKMTYNNGGIYQGMWKNDKQEGKGKFTEKRGDVYEGEWSHGIIRNSNIKIAFSNGNLFSGEIEGSFMHGNGIMTFQNGSQYQGLIVIGEMGNTWQ